MPPSGRSSEKKLPAKRPASASKAGKPTCGKARFGKERFCWKKKKKKIDQCFTSNLSLILMLWLLGDCCKDQWGLDHSVCGYELWTYLNIWGKLVIQRIAKPFGFTSWSQGGYHMIKPFPCLNFWASVEAELDSTVATVDFEDLSANAFGVTISRVQQEALKAASCRVPTPSEQLALVAERREKKTTLTHDWNT